MRALYALCLILGGIIVAVNILMLWTLPDVDYFRSLWMQSGSLIEHSFLLWGMSIALGVVLVFRSGWRQVYGLAFAIALLVTFKGAVPSSVWQLIMLSIGALGLYAGIDLILRGLNLPRPKKRVAP